MQTLQWRKFRGSEYLCLRLMDVEVSSDDGAWMATIRATSPLDAVSGDIIHDSWHPTVEEAKTAAFTKAKELLLDDLNALGGI